MSWTCQGYTSTSEIKTFDSRVKQKVLNDESVKTSKFNTRLCHVLPSHYDVKMAFSHFLTFLLTESRDQVIFLILELRKLKEHFLVGPLKMSS